MKKQTNKKGHTVQKFTAFISDLDDTLLTADHSLTDRTAEALYRIQRQGVHVILASGRSAASMRPIVRKAGTTSPFIAYNGAQIVDSVTGEVIHSEEIPAELTREVLKWLSEENVYMQTYYGDDWFYEKEYPFAADYARATNVIGTLVESLQALATRPTPKVLGVDKPERVRELIERGKERFGERLSITSSKAYFLEITMPGATKGIAVRALAGRLGFTKDTAVIAGDSLNDLSMLTWTNYPVTVENAREEIKSIAWRVGGHAHQDGIAELLAEIFPEG